MPKFRQESLKTFDDLANSVGAVPALILTSFFAGTCLYIPDSPTPNHLISQVIGSEAFGYLCRSHGSQSLNIPSLELLSIRRAGRLHQLLKIGASDGLCSQLLGVSKKQIVNLKNDLKKLDLKTLDLLNEEDL